MEGFKVYVKNADKEIEVDSQTSLMDIAKMFGKYAKGKILAANVDNAEVDLKTKLFHFFCLIFIQKISLRNTF